MSVHFTVLTAHLWKLIAGSIGCLTARQHRKANLCQLRGGKLAQAAKDGQRDTMHNTLRHTITM